MEKYINTIQRSSRIGLWVSVTVVIITALFHFVSSYRFYPSTHTAHWMLVAGSVLAVLAVSMSLLVIRKQIPALRQAEGLEHKLSGYAQHIRSLYLEMMVVVVLICAMTVLSAQNMLLMLAMVATLMLFLAYPNMYKIKIDLGLSDEEMKTLFGDKYIISGADESK